MTEQDRPWYVHCAKDRKAELAEFLSACTGSNRCVFREDYVELVGDVQSSKKARVALGPGVQIDQRNLCGFLISEAPQAEVLIIAEEMGEEFREQAKRAGASWVLSAEDTVEFTELGHLADEHEEKQSLQGKSKNLSVVSSAPHTYDESSLPDEMEEQPSAYEEDDLDEPEGFEFDTNVLRLDRLNDFGKAQNAELQVPRITGENERSTSSLSQEAALSEVVSPLIAFASARGGVGKSTVASLVALAMASLEKRVALLDLDLNFGNMFGFFGRASAADLTPLSEEVNAPALQKCGERINDNLDLYGPCEKPEYAELIVPKIPQLLATLSQVYEIVLIDTSSSWGDATACAAQMAHKICLMSDERTGAISSLARGATLLVRLGIPRTKVVRLINRADPKRRDQDFFARKNPGLEQATTLSTFDGGLDVAEFLSAGDAPSLLNLENPFTSSCKSLCARLLQEVGALPQSRLAREYLEGKPKSGGTLLQFAQRALLKDAS